MKKWYLSKTLWANFLGLVVMLLSYAVTEGWVASAIEGFAMIPINWVLRLLTDQPIQSPLATDATSTPPQQ